MEVGGRAVLALFAHDMDTLKPFVLKVGSGMSLPPAAQAVAATAVRGDVVADPDRMLRDYPSTTVVRGLKYIADVLLPWVVLGIIIVHGPY